MASDVREALKSKLAVDSTLAGLAPGGIFSDDAQQNATPPYVVFDKMSGIAVNQTFRGEPDTNALYLVKGISQKKAEAEAIDARCRAILHRADLGAETFKTSYLLIESDVDMIETPEGERYDHVGTVYRLITEPKED